VSFSAKLVYQTIYSNNPREDKMGKLIVLSPQQTPLHPSRSVSVGHNGEVTVFVDLGEQANLVYKYFTLESFDEGKGKLELIFAPREVKERSSYHTMMMRLEETFSVSRICSFDGEVRKSMNVRLAEIAVVGHDTKNKEEIGKLYLKYTVQGDGS